MYSLFCPSLIVSVLLKFVYDTFWKKKIKKKKKKEWCKVQTSSFLCFAGLVFGQNYTCHSCEYYDGDGSDPYECVTDPSMVGRVVGCGHGPTFECFSRNKISRKWVSAFRNGQNLPLQWTLYVHQPQWTYHFSIVRGTVSQKKHTKGLLPYFSWEK